MFIFHGIVNWLSTIYLPSTEITRSMYQGLRRIDSASFKMWMENTEYICSSLCCTYNSHKGVHLVSCSNIYSSKYKYNIYPRNRSTCIFYDYTYVHICPESFCEILLQCTFFSSFLNILTKLFLSTEFKSIYFALSTAENISEYRKIE